MTTGRGARTGGDPGAERGPDVGRGDAGARSAPAASAHASAATGSAATGSGTAAQTHRGAKTASGAGPLHGLRVVEIAAIGPAPFACMMLADLGAEVIRVDRARSPRAFPQAHRLLERGRRSVALDLKDPDAAGALMRLVDRADVLVEGFRPGVAERLGIGPDCCLRRNPRLVYGRMTGWGQDGPLARAPGHDINYIGLTGALHAIGRRGGPPVPPLNLLGDFAGGGMLLVTGILAALHERRSSGRGQVVDAAIVDGVATMLGTLLGMAEAGQWGEERGTNLLDTGAPFYDVYACADGRHVAVGALEPRFYAALLAGLGLDAEELPDRDDPANWPALRSTFASAFVTGTREQWVEVFDGTQACVTPVLTVDEAARHPHLRERGTYPAPDGVRQPAPAPRFSRTGGPLPGPGSAPGQDTVEILAGCGYGADEIERLLASGAADVPEAAGPVRGRAVPPTAVPDRPVGGRRVPGHTGPREPMAQGAEAAGAAPPRPVPGAPEPGSREVTAAAPGGPTTTGRPAAVEPAGRR